MESAHQFSFRPDCSNATKVPSFTLRTALSAIPLVSDRCGVDVQWFQESSQTLSNSKELSVWMTLRFLSDSRNFCKLLWVSCEVLFLHGYAWIHWVAKSSTMTAYRWLFWDSQIVTQNLVICCWQITKFFSTKYGSAIASSARGSCNFCPGTNLEMSVFGKMSVTLCLLKSSRLLNAALKILHPLLQLLSSCMNWSSFFPCNNFLHIFAPQKKSHLRCCLHTPRRGQ